MRSGSARDDKCRSSTRPEYDHTHIKKDCSRKFGLFKNFDELKERKKLEALFFLQKKVKREKK